MSFREGGFRGRRRSVALDLTPLIDCIFQLLVFFLLTASFVATPNLKVDLPKASAQSASATQRDVLVVVTRTGDIQIDGATLAPAALRARLAALKKERPDARVLIQADRKAYHGHVVRVMDAAKAAGFRRLGVAIRSGN